MKRAARGRARGPIAWMAGNSVAANLLMLFLLVGGLIVGSRVKQEVFPEFDLDLVTVTVVYPGASPAEVEQGIILAIEDAVQGLDGVDQVTSSAREGVGSVTVELLLGADLQKLARDIESEVDRITSFPLDAEEPQITIASRKREVIELALYGPQTLPVLHQLAEDLRDALLQAGDITQVELAGVRALEIAIEVPQAQLRRHGLTLDQIAGRVRQTALELPGGGIKGAAGEVLVRMTERRDYGREFAAIALQQRSDGSPLRLEDVARIIDGYEDSDYSAWYNGQPAVLVRVFRIGDQTPTGVAAAVHARVEQWRAEVLPPGVALEVLQDRSVDYRQRAELLLKNAYLGLVLVLVLLSLFLEARLAFWVTLGIPVSFLGAFFLIAAHGVSINMMSMFAFIIALGIVVDDAIVVGENVYQFRQQGLSFGQAAVAGAREVALPVTFSILTNIAAFLPLYFVPGVMGKIMLVIPVVVISVFVISLIESLLVLPAHLGHLREEPRRWGPLRALHGLQQRFSAAFSRFVEGTYGPLLERLLRWRYVVIAFACTSLLLMAAYVQSGRLGMSLFPKVEADFAQATLTLPYGAPVAHTRQLCERLVAAAEQVAERHGGAALLRGSFVEIGQNGGHSALLRLYLTDPARRPISTDSFVRQWREQVGTLAGIESLRFESDAGGPGSGAALTIELSHRELAVLEQASAELAEALRAYPAVSDIDDGFAPGKQQLDFRLSARGQAFGLTVQEVARQVRHAYDGAEVLRQQRGRNEVTVRVRLPEAERVSEYDLEQMVLRSADGREIALREAVEIERGRAYISIDRRSGRRIVTATADVTPRSRAGQISAALERDTLPQLLQRYPGLSYGYEGRQADLRESVRGLFLGLLLALLLIYLLLAIPFRSYIQPAIIMISIPFGMIGATIGHVLMGYSLSLMSLFGVVALAGVVVNDSLVLIDFANRRRQAGDSAHDAIVAAAIQRFRPILLTTLTTFCGLAPMIFETSRQARFLIPMAISLGFGILFATLIALLLVPLLYLLVEDLKGLTSRFSTSRGNRTLPS